VVELNDPLVGSDRSKRTRKPISVKEYLFFDLYYLIDIEVSGNRNFNKIYMQRLFLYYLATYEGAWKCVLTASTAVAESVLVG
jgi:hypothetical protein